MSAVTEMPAPVVFTGDAADWVKKMTESEKNPNLKLRICVIGGGCSGLQYSFAFDETVQEDDIALEKNGVTLLVDPMSLQYLAGAEIGYLKDAQGEQLTIKNPNATATCDCGSSFAA